MGQLLLMVGTTKGAFFFTSDEKRHKWEMSGPHLPGWEIYSLLCDGAGNGNSDGGSNGGSNGTPRLLAGTAHYSFGATVRVSDDMGQSWQQPDGRPEYPKDSGFKVNRIWQLVSHPARPGTIFAGIDEAGLFVSNDRGGTWSEIRSLAGDPPRKNWFPGNGGLCLHTILIDPANPRRMWVGISAVGALRTDDGGETWKNLNRTLPALPTGSPDNATACCVHKIVQDPRQADTLYMQYHGGVLKSTDAGDTWTAIESGLPSNFGFPLAVTRGGDLFVCPLDSDEKRYAKDGKLRVYRSQDGGANWHACTKGLPAEPTYVGVLRDAMATDPLDPAGVYFGTTMGEVYASVDSGDSWQKLPAQLPRVTTVKTAIL